MMLHRLCTFLTAVALLCSCAPSVQFPEPMPPGRINLPNFPKAMRGSIIEEDVSTVIGKDTLRMGDEVLVNGEDFLLRRMAGHVVFNKRVPETGHWEVIPIRQTKDSMILCAFDDNLEFLERVKSLLEVAPESRNSVGPSGYDYILLSPSAKEFKVLLQERLYDDEEGGALLPKGGEVRP